MEGLAEKILRGCDDFLHGTAHFGAIPLATSGAKAMNLIIIALGLRQIKATSLERFHKRLTVAIAIGRVEANGGLGLVHGRLIQEGCMGTHNCTDLLMCGERDSQLATPAEANDTGLASQTDALEVGQDGLRILGPLSTGTLKKLTKSLLELRG